MFQIESHFGLLINIGEDGDTVPISYFLLYISYRKTTLIDLIIQTHMHLLHHNTLY